MKKYGLLYSTSLQASSRSAEREAILPGLHGNFDAYKYPQQ
jgi:hypothetical protein